MAFGQRFLARVGGIRGGRIDRHIADREDRSVGRAGRPNGGQGGSKKQDSGGYFRS